MSAPVLRWRRVPPSWTGGEVGYALGRNAEEDGEPYADVRSDPKGCWYWYGYVRGQRRNTVREGLRFTSAAAAQADALLWVRARLGRTS